MKRMMTARWLRARRGEETAVFVNFGKQAEGVRDGQS